MASRKGIEFSTDISPDVPSVLNTDEQRLRQVLKNLLSNAFKFTETGSVKLEINKAKPEVLIAARDDLQVDTVIEISVHDTGIGIANDKQELIFKAFRQADGTTSRKYGGTGLGLTISRDIANLMGGYIEVKSVVGQGSTFILYLPSYVKSNPYQAVQQSAATLSVESIPASVSIESQEVLAGKKVLIIDDDMRNLFALTSALESQHMEAIVAENGKEGIELIQEHPDVDLVLMDVMMPEMDGYKAMRLIRDIPKFKDLPIIALTAKAMKNDREQCLQAGASDYISKPVNLEQLLSLMRVWLYR
ncbi:response regulator [bacterium BFN5]|nr:response regulator [bacterium BFN5]